MHDVKLAAYACPYAPHDNAATLFVVLVNAHREHIVTALDFYSTQREGAPSC